MEGSRFVNEHPKYYDSTQIDKFHETCIDEEDEEISRATVVAYLVFAVIPMVILLVLFSI